MAEKLEIIVDKKVKFIKSEGIYVEFKGTYILHEDNESESIIKLFYRHRIPSKHNNTLINMLHDEFIQNNTNSKHSLQLKKYTGYTKDPDRSHLEIKIPKDKYEIIIN